MSLGSLESFLERTMKRRPPPCALCEDALRRAEQAEAERDEAVRQREAIYAAAWLAGIRVEALKESLRAQEADTQLEE